MVQITEVNDGIVSNYCIEELRDGSINLMFNTENKGIHFHQYNNSRYVFIDNTSGIEMRSNIEIPGFDPDFMLSYSTQCKDQISFIFIPKEHHLSDKMLNAIIKRKIELATCGNLSDKDGELLERLIEYRTRVGILKFYENKDEWEKRLKTSLPEATTD